MNSPKLLVPALVVVAAISYGCATKKYVREQIAPVDQRASELAKKNADAIAQLEEKSSKEISRVEERAMTAENRAAAAGRAAEQAQQSANEAGQAAQNARQLAEQTQTRLGEVANFLRDADKYKLVSSESVLFGFDRSVLTPEARQKLDAIAQNAAGMDRYVIEIEGYADPTGPSDYNLALSRRRADAVVRYLLGKNVPLRRIHMIGLGEGQRPGNGAAVSLTGMSSEKPATGRQARREARRVEVKVYAPEATLQAITNPPAAASVSPQGHQSDSNSPQQ